MNTFPLVNADSIYAFYGSLRRGMSNYGHFEKGLQFLFQTEVAGYQLFAMKAYPYAIKTGRSSDLLTVEVFRVVDPAVEQAIHNLEIGVGYHYDEISIQGQLVGIYLFERAGQETLVKGGDWIQFFGS